MKRFLLSALLLLPAASMAASLAEDANSAAEFAGAADPAKMSASEFKTGVERLCPTCGEALKIYETVCGKATTASLKSYLEESEAYVQSLSYIGTDDDANRIKKSVKCIKPPKPVKVKTKPESATKGASKPAPLNEVKKTSANPSTKGSAVSVQ